ncbi:MAG: sulfite oxidase [Rubrobacteraceae bacterium]
MTEPVARRNFREEEVRLAFRNHGMHIEGIRYPVTPVGMHYLLVHFDVPMIDAADYELPISGLVRNPSTLTLDDIRELPKVSVPVVMECSGNGRGRLSDPPISDPWQEEAVGCAEWTGTPLGSILREVDVLEEAVEILFTGHDRGVDSGVEYDFARSLPVEEAMNENVLLAYEMNGQPLPPQHGFPLRLLVPEWYGMASVKWLKSISAIGEPFEGVEQKKYHYKQTEDEPGIPVTRKNPRALLVPPGVPDSMSRERYVSVGRHHIEGRAWSGFGPVVSVEFSTDGGRTWDDTTLDEPASGYGWRPWSYVWEVSEPGDYELCARATDDTGRTQPLDADQLWNVEGYGINSVQRVPVSVSGPA